MAGLHAGAAVADITPTDAQFLFGYPHVNRYSTGVNDPLLSTALYLSDGATQAILVANDAIFVPRASAVRVRAAINAATGVPAAHIMLTATHTHSAPKTVEYLSNADDPLVPPVDPAYLRLFEAQMIAAACAAVREARPAQAGLAVADGTGVGTNRRKVSGPADPQAPVLLVKTADGQGVIACMVVYSMHPTVFRENSSVVSADFPGATRRTLPRTVMPAGCPILYHTGPAGDQSPRHVLRGSSIAEVERLGGLLGEAIARVIPSVVCRADLALQVGQRFVELPRRAMPTAAQARPTWSLPQPAWRSSAALAHHRRKCAVPRWTGSAPRRPSPWPAPRPMAGWKPPRRPACRPKSRPSESGRGPSSVGRGGLHGTRARAQGAAPDTFVISLANGELQGYIATEEAAMEGGYEATNALFSPGRGACDGGRLAGPASRCNRIGKKRHLASIRSARLIQIGAPGARKAHSNAHSQPHKQPRGSAWFNGAVQMHHRGGGGFEIGIAAGGDRAEQGRAQTGRFLALHRADRLARHIRLDLQPERAACAAADAADLRDREAHPLDQVKLALQHVRDRFHEPTDKMTPAVAQRCPEEDGARLGIVLGRERAFQVRQHGQTIAAGGHAAGRSRHQVVRVEAGLLRGHSLHREELIAEPLQRHAGGLTPGEETIQAGSGVIEAGEAAVGVKIRAVRGGDDRQRTARRLAHQPGPQVARAERADRLVERTGDRQR